MDSQAPNKVFAEYIRAGNFFENVALIKPEVRYQNSPFDFYIEAKGERIFVEVKGVTLEENGVVLFPDAPTARGVKHLEKLWEAQTEGYRAQSATHTLRVDPSSSSRYSARVPVKESSPSSSHSARASIHLMDAPVPPLIPLGPTVFTLEKLTFVLFVSPFSSSAATDKFFSVFTASLAACCCNFFCFSRYSSHHTLVLLLLDTELTLITIPSLFFTAF
ncbi:MAG: DNA/RNA nuclease SfsA [Synergistaceae bacterium]|nr:DNA/RNA nuclease SfsA [Synergistaceae bacterium]